MCVPVDEIPVIILTIHLPGMDKLHDQRESSPPRVPAGASLKNRYLVPGPTRYHIILPVNMLLPMIITVIEFTGSLAY